MRRVLAAICLGLSLPAADAVAQKPAQVTLEEVLAAWTARQAATKSGRFHLTEEVIKPAGAAKDGKGGGPRVPERDTKCLAEHDVAFEGRRYRHAISGTRWSDNGGGCVACDDVLTFDGDLSRMFRPTSPGADRPQGTIRAGTKMMDTRSLLLTPIFICLRPNEPQLVAFNPDELTVSGRAMEIAGRRCRELISERPGAGRRNVLHIWVDPAMKFVPVRMTKVEGDNVLFEITITHESNALVGGLPTSWTTSLYMRPRVLTEARVVRANPAEINVDVPDSDFTIEFPPGTMLYDERTETDGVVKEGNKLRKLSYEEMQKPYSEILQLPGPTTSIDHPNSRRWWYWVVGSAGLLAIVFVIGLRKWRKRRQAG